MTLLCMLLAPAPQASAAGPTETRASAGMAVSVTKSKRACFIDTFLVMGVLVGKNEVLVRPDREGLQISQILVEAGDAVAAGQVLARLTPPAGQQGAAVAIRAPVAGIAVAAPTVVGMSATARGEPLFRIIADGEMELSAEIAGKQIGKVSPGQTAKIKIAGMDELQGRVQQVSTTVDPTSQLGQVRIFVGNQSRLRVGAFGRAMIDVGQSCGVAVPLTAILYGPDGTVIQVVRENRIETRRVILGLLDEANAEIRDGLVEGDMVIVRAGAFLREGDRVRPVVVGEPK